MGEADRYALLIGNDTFVDERLARLHAPTEDVLALRDVLLDPQIGGFDSGKVDVILNASLDAAQDALVRLFEDKRSDDLLLLYYSGHGLLTDNLSLYFALTGSSFDRPQAKSLSATFLTEMMDASYSRRQIIILDCCHSGAFRTGQKKGAAHAITQATFDPVGHGRYVLTASGDTQPALDGGPPDDGAASTLSRFTHFLVEGLRTGAAAPNSETISIDQLFDFVYPRVKSPVMKPRKFVDEGSDKLVIAKNPNPKAELPEPLAAALGSGNEYERLGAVSELGRLVRGADRALANAALEALEARAPEEKHVDVHNAVARALAGDAETEDAAAFEDRLSELEDENRALRASANEASSLAEKEQRGLAARADAELKDLRARLDDESRRGSEAERENAKLAATIERLKSGAPRTSLGRRERGLWLAALLASVLGLLGYVVTGGGPDGELEEISAALASAESETARLSEDLERAQASVAQLRDAEAETARLSEDLERAQASAAQLKDAEAELGRLSQEVDRASALAARELEGRLAAERAGRKARAEAARLAQRVAELEQAQVGAPAVAVAPAVPESPPAGDTFRDCPECPEMVVIPPGRFTMGSPKGEEGRDDDEGPQREVTIARRFAVGVHEVTFAEWDACVAAGGCNGRKPSDEGWGRSARPVVNVRWQDAQAYVDWLSKKTGETYRLLSEAEWEYVARAGTRTRFWWGDDIGADKANCAGCGSRWDGQSTAPVGSFEPNAFGLHDVHGNVSEWVEDTWHDHYRGAPKDGSAWTSSLVSGGDVYYRVWRGGSWDRAPRSARAAVRNATSYDNRSSAIGFRVARTL